MTRQTSRKNVSRKHTTRKTSRNTKKKRISKKKNSRKPKNVLIGGSRKMEDVFKSLEEFKKLVTKYQSIDMRPPSGTGEEKKKYIAKQKNEQSIEIKKIIEEIKKYPKPLSGFMPGSLKHLTEPRAEGQYSHIELCSDEFKTDIVLIVKAIEESLLKIHLHRDKPKYLQSPIQEVNLEEMVGLSLEIKYNNLSEEVKLGDIIQLNITGGKKYEIYIRLDENFDKCKLNAKKVTELELDNVYLEGKDAVMYFTPEEEGNIIKVYGGIQNVKVPGGDPIEKGIVNTLFAITDEMMNKNTNPTATFIDDLHNLISKSKGKEDINQKNILTIEDLINNYTNLPRSGDFYVLATKETISGNHNNNAGAAAGPAREEAGPAREETGPARAATGGPNN